MKRKIIGSLFLTALFVQPAFANHGIDAMGDAIAFLFVSGLLMLVISVISIIVSYRAYNRNKTSLKIIATVLSIPIGVSAILLLNFNFVFAILPIAIVITNMLLIANAKPQVTDFNSNLN